MYLYKLLAYINQIVEAKNVLKICMAKNSFLSMEVNKKYRVSNKTCF